MKSNSSVMQKMLWKDAKALWPLVQAILFGIVAFNLLGLLASKVMHTPDTYQIYMAFWMLMPNLVAIGAPALLVGGEEESGTFAWLRTLPVTWQRIVDSKFIVSIIAVLGTWLVSSIIAFALCYSSTGGMRSVSGSHLDAAELLLDAAELLSFGGIAHVVFMSLTLLATGFAIAYLIRSPITALIVLVPVMAIFYQVTSMLGQRFLSGSWYQHRSFGTINASPSRWVILVLGAIVWLVGLWLVQRLLGKRRLTSAGRSRKPIEKKSPKLAYRPPTGVGLQTPSTTFALLWQQGRQIGIAVTAMTGASVLFLLLQLSVTRSDVSEVVREFGPLIVGLSAIWIGALVFYGDSVRRQCAYFADRGISPTQVWWTRMLIPGLCCLILTGIAAFADAMPRSRSLFPWFVIPVLFGFGQLISQWVSRPILSFFAAPVYAGACCFYYGVFFDRYQGYGWTTCLLLPVLLFATWRLTRRWVDGRMDSGFHLRAVGYTAIAVAVPICVVVGYRIATTPKQDSHWRKQATAAASEIDCKQGEVIGFYGYGSWHRNPVHSIEPVGYPVFLQSLQDELNAVDSVGDFVSAQELRSIQHQRFTHAVNSVMLTRIRYLGVEVMLKWAAVGRQEAAQGRLGLHTLEGYVEGLEGDAVNMLISPEATKETEKVIRRLVQMIPSKDLRHRSRQVALLREWRRFQEPGGKPPRSLFLGQYFPDGYGLTFLEKRRSSRFIDELVKELMDPQKTAANQRVLYYWQQARSVSDGYFNPDLLRFDSWTADYEKKIEKLRKRYPSTRENTNAEKLEGIKNN